MGTGSTLLERAVELYNARDLDGYMDLYAEDAVLEAPDGVYHGRRSIQERLARELAGFPDATFTVSTIVEQGDAFADEFVFTGTHTAPYVLPDGTRLPATGRRLEVKGMEFVRVRDGRIVVDNLYFDTMAYLVQFGLLPQGVAAAAN